MISARAAKEDADQHRKIADSAIAILNNMGRSKPEDIISAIERFYLLIKDHFAKEENLMMEEEYYNVNLHRADHEKMLNTTRSLLDSAKEVDAEQLRDISKLTSIISDWTTLHFNKFDKKFNDYINQKPS